MVNEQTPVASQLPPDEAVHIAIWVTVIVLGALPKDRDAELAICLASPDDVTDPQSEGAISFRAEVTDVVMSVPLVPARPGSLE